MLWPGVFSIMMQWLKWCFSKVPAMPYSCDKAERLLRMSINSLNELKEILHFTHYKFTRSETCYWCLDGQGRDTDILPIRSACQSPADMWIFLNSFWSNQSIIIEILNQQFKQFYHLPEKWNTCFERHWKHDSNYGIPHFGSFFLLSAAKEIKS